MTAYPQTHAFKGATIILPVINETYSLVQTVDAILATSRADLRELLIVVADKTTPQAMAEVERLAAGLEDLIVVHCQELKFLGGAMREAFDLARGIIPAEINRVFVDQRRQGRIVRHLAVVLEHEGEGCG